MDTFAITIAVIFIATLIVSYFKATSKDACLKLFKKSMIVVKLKNGDTMWGRFFLESTGFLLVYEKPHDNVTHLETGFFIYKSEYPTLFGVFRPVSLMNEIELRERENLMKVYRKGFFVWLRDKTRNFFSAVRDAIVQSFNLFLGRYLVPKSSVIASNKKYISSVGQSAVEFVGNAYDPLLERNIGKKVVYEVNIGDDWKEFVGVLMKYTKDFLAIFDTEFPLDVNLKIKGDGTEEEHFNVRFSRKGSKLEISNRRGDSIEIAVGEKTYKIDKGERKILEIPENVEFRMVLRETFDVVFPRSICIVRHTAR